MKILVTGGAGFIGSNLVDRLVEDGHSVDVVDNLSTGKKDYLNSKAKFYNKDIRNLEEIKPLFKNIDWVFHLAAQPRIQPSIKKPDESHGNNVSGTLNVLIASKDAGVKKFIYSASSSAYGDQQKLPLKEDMEAKPKTPYSVFKWVGEKYCKLFTDLYNLPTVCLRYFNVYGPRQSTEGAYATVIGIFLKQAKNNQPLTIVGDGKQTRDFTHVKDIIQANILAAQSNNVGKAEVINIGSGKNYSINQVAKMISNNTINIAERPGEVQDTLADNSKAKKLFNWEPSADLEQGIRELLE